MPFGEILPVKTKVTIKDTEFYHKALSGSQLVCSLYDAKNNNLIARGSGLSWNETFQQTDLPEWGQRHSIETVTGRQPIGQLTIQTFFFMQLNDALPTTQGLKNWAVDELIAQVQIAAHEDPRLAGLVIDVYEGVKIAAQSGNWNAQSQYMRNVSLIYRIRKSGADYYLKNKNATYPANIEVDPIAV
jgi:hypothetical protein